MHCCGSKIGYVAALTSACTACTQLVYTVTLKFPFFWLHISLFFLSKLLFYWTNIFAVCKKLFQFITMECTIMLYLPSYVAPSMYTFFVYQPFLFCLRPFYSTYRSFLSKADCSFVVAQSGECLCRWVTLSSQQLTESK